MLTIFLEFRFQKTVRSLKQIMSADKYPCLFSRPIEAIVYIFPKWHSLVSKAYVQYDNSAFKISFNVTEFGEEEKYFFVYKVVPENAEKCGTSHTVNVKLIVNILSLARQKYINDSKYSSKMFFLGTDRVCGKISEHIFVLNRSNGTYVIRRRIGTNQGLEPLETCLKQHSYN